VSQGGYGCRGSAPTGDIARHTDEILHLVGLAHARDDASRLVQQNKGPRAASIGDGFYEELKRLVALGASLVAAVVHPSNDAIE
jgi:hypothetical protein